MKTKNKPLTESWEIAALDNGPLLADSEVVAQAAARTKRNRRVAVTSKKQYEERVIPNAGTVKQRILSILEKYPKGATIFDIQRGLNGKPINTFSGRLTDLVDEGCIQVIDETEDGVNVYKSVIVNVPSKE